MKTPLTAILVAGTLCTPAYAGTFIGGSEAGVPQSRPAPPISTPNPDRFGYPDLDPTARRVGDRLCYAFIPIGASRTQDICIPTQNFADTLDPKPDMIGQVFAGNTLDTDVEQLARCHIRRRDDPGIGTAPTDDPTNGYQFDLRCPSRREGGGHYDLSMAFNRDYYLPYRLVDSVCGPDQATVGSQFDQYVRTTLGEPTAVDPGARPFVSITGPEQGRTSGSPRTREGKERARIPHPSSAVGSAGSLSPTPPGIPSRRTWPA